MTLTTEDLRDALAEAAGDPYLPVGGSRLSDVRARVRTIRRRRATAAATASGMAIVAVAASFVLGHGSPTVSPVPASSPRPSVVPLPAMPALWGVRDVVGQVSGSGWQAPSTRLPWPSGTTGVLVHCTGTDRAVQVDVRPDTGVASRTSIPCQGTNAAWQPADLPVAASSIPAGAGVTVQAQLDAPEAGTAFGVALLVGKNLIDGSVFATPPRGYDTLAAVSLSDGEFSSWTGAGIDPAAGTADDHVQNGAQILLEGRHAVHLKVRCSGRSTLDITREQIGGPTSVECPADERVERHLDLSLTPATEQRLDLRFHGDPGALVQVGVYAR
jgi:hypothetical protein